MESIAKLMGDEGSTSVSAGDVVDTGSLGVEILEQDRRVSRCKHGKSCAQMVVERQQLDSSRSVTWQKCGGKHGSNKTLSLGTT